MSCLNFISIGTAKISRVRDAHRIISEYRVAQIRASAVDVPDMPEIFQRVENSMHRRCETYIAAANRLFERLL